MREFEAGLAEGEAYANRQAELLACMTLDLPSYDDEPDLATAISDSDEDMPESESTPTDEDLANLAEKTSLASLDDESKDDDEFCIVEHGEL